MFLREVIGSNDGYDKDSISNDKMEWWLSVDRWLLTQLQLICFHSEVALMFVWTNSILYMKRERYNMITEFHWYVWWWWFYIFLALGYKSVSGVRRRKSSSSAKNYQKLRAKSRVRRPTHIYNEWRNNPNQVWWHTSIPRRTNQMLFRLPLFAS